MPADDLLCRVIESTLWAVYQDAILWACINQMRHNTSETYRDRVTDAMLLALSSKPRVR